MNARTLGERLEMAMREEGVSQAELGRALGISRSAVNQIVQRVSKGFKPEHLVLACRRLRIRPEWLALGEEPMRPDDLTLADRAFLRAYQSLPPAKRETVASVVKDMASTYP